MPSTSTRRGGAVKQVACTFCGNQCEVAKRAMSIFCPHCKKRLVLEDFKITSYYAVREFFTCGDIVVEKKGHVVAAIKADKLTIKGKVQGKVAARGQVKLTKTGSLKGEREAVSLKIDSGAHLDATVRIGVTDAE